MKAGFKLNILDITIITAVVLIIIASILAVWRNKTKPNINLTVVLISDEYIPEVFSGIKNGSEVYNSDNGKLLGEIGYTHISEGQSTSQIEIDVETKAESLDNGAVIDGDNYYKGDRLLVKMENSRILCLIKDLKIKY